MVLRLSSNKIDRSDDETNFPHKLLLTNRQVSDLCKAFTNNLSVNIKLLKTQLSRRIQSGQFLGRLLCPLIKTGLLLINNVLKSLVNSVLIPLGVASASVADAGMHKKILGSGTTTLIISIEDLEDIMKIVKSLEDPGLLMKGISETIQNKAKELKCEFLVMLLRKLGASLLGNVLRGKGVK